jgi:hypothetical protein
MSSVDVVLRQAPEKALRPHFAKDFAKALALTIIHTNQTICSATASTLNHLLQRGMAVLNRHDDGTLISF